MIMKAFRVEEYMVALYYPQLVIILVKKYESDIPRDPFAKAQRPLRQTRPSAPTSTGPYQWRGLESATASPYLKQGEF